MGKGGGGDFYCERTGGGRERWRLLQGGGNPEPGLNVLKIPGEKHR